MTTTAERLATDTAVPDVQGFTAGHVRECDDGLYARPLGGEWSGPYTTFVAAQEAVFSPPPPRRFDAKLGTPVELPTHVYHMGVRPVAAYVFDSQLVVVTCVWIAHEPNFTAYVGKHSSRGVHGSIQSALDDLEMEVRNEDSRPT